MFDVMVRALLWPVVLTTNSHLESRKQNFDYKLYFAIFSGLKIVVKDVFPTVMIVEMMDYLRKNHHT